MLVGYSGGADSTCMLHLLASLPVDVVAAHLHHGQREEADDELARCEAFCQTLDVPFLPGRADVPAIAAQMGMGLEEAGRHARYEFFRQAAFQTQCTLIATGHTRDDHVETVILNLARGCGLSGLAGIPPQREAIVRPMLIFTRMDTRAFCDELGLWYHDDPANDDVDFARARIRHRVLPELRLVNARVDQAVHRLSQMAHEEDLFLDSAAAAGLERCERSLNAHLQFLTADVEAAFDGGLMRHLPPVLLKRGIRLIARLLGAELSHDQTLRIAEGLRDEGRGSVTAEGGEVVIEWTKAAVHARRLRAPEPFRYNLTVPGETESDEFGWRFVAREAAPQELTPDSHNLSVLLDRAAVNGVLHFRTFKAGDVIQPLGLDGQKKVADVFSDAHLTEAARRRLPVVCDMLGPVWLPGLCIAERVKITPSTSLAIALRFEPLSQADSHNKETA